MAEHLTWLWKCKQNLAYATAPSNLSSLMSQIAETLQRHFLKSFPSMETFYLSRPLGVAYFEDISCEA